jgi:CBS domain-containing protein
VNFIHDCFIQKAIFFAEQQLLVEGMASPSIPYAFVLFGSGGRMEQTPYSDQDNGLIYDDQHDAYRSTDAAYFAKLGATIVTYLKQVGYPPCEGEVGANNPFWCKSKSAWLATFDEWVADPTWENIRYLLIFADVRCVYGEEALVQGMQNQIGHYSDTHPAILQAMLNNTLRHKIMLNVFGQLLVEPYGEHAGCVDVKYGGYIPIINSIRLFAIKEHVVETSSLKRLEALYQVHAINSEQWQAWRDALLTILALREQTKNQLSDQLYGSSGMVVLQRLDKQAKTDLKNALHAGRKLQKFVQQRLR